MTEEEWLACEDPRTLFPALSPAASDRKLLLFCVHCCFFNSDEPNSDTATYIHADLWRLTERFADGKVGETELCNAWGEGAVWPLRPYPAALRWVDRDDSDEIDDAEIARLLRDIFGNPFRPVTFSPAWHTDTAVVLARQMYESREFSAMPILADALQDAGCDREDILDHCRGAGPHVRGCWVCDLVLGKE